MYLPVYRTQQSMKPVPSEINEKNIVRTFKNQNFPYLKKEDKLYRLTNNVTVFEIILLHVENVTCVVMEDLI